MSISPTNVVPLPVIIRVSIVEDNAVLRGTLEKMFNEAPGMRCVSTHPTGEDAVSKMPAANPDVALVDIHLPGMGGIECVAKLKWQFPYNPPVILFAVNRGVGIEDGKVLLGTQDCRVIALNAETGKPVWDVPGCRDATNSFFSMAAYVYKDSVILGTGGGDNGNRGHVSAFSVV